MTDWIYVVSFYAVAAVALSGALGVLFLRNLFHAGLSLMLSLFAVAAIFVLLGAEFLAGVQVLIYVGAVAVLILFAVMLTERITSRNVRQYTRALVPALLVVAGLAAGAVPALIAIAPHLLAQPAQVPWLSLGLPLLGVLAVGQLGISLLHVKADLLEDAAIAQ